MPHPSTLTNFATWAAQTYGDAIALRFAGGHMSYVDLSDRVNQFASALVAKGVRPGDRVALLSETCPEWTVCDLAISAIGAVCVPVYPTNSAEEKAWVLGDSGTSLVISDFGGLRGTGDFTPPERDPLSAHTIIYTSGTTGPPKGCVITHANWWATLDAITSLSSLGPGSVVYLYLPLAHMFARTVQFACLLTGATIAYWGGSLSGIVDELAAVRPTHLPSVPRLFEKAYARVRGLPPEVVQSLFGGRVVEALTGGAPIAKEILDFFHLCRVPIYEAYGMTEATALITSNAPGAARAGTVGKALPGVEVRIAPDGEVLTRGPHVFAGYHNNLAATSESIVDGWLHTGDLGELDDDGYLTITGRKKELIITSGGKNLSPANMENDLRQCQLISQAVMYGDRRPYAVALITLDAEEVARAGLSRQEAIARIDSHVAQVNQRYAPPERVRRHLVLEHDFSVEAGDLTPSLKVRRKVVFERYADLFESLYDN